MLVQNAGERDSVLGVVWLSASAQAELNKIPLPLSLPWSQSFYLCCQDIRNFIQRFYQFVEGVSQHHRNIDELLSKVCPFTSATTIFYLQVPLSPWIPSSQAMSAKALASV
jgi:hypothetical protein